MTFPADDFATPEPLFYVQPPDGSRRPELPRQTAFLRDMRLLAPSVLVYANANAGKRNPLQAKREGIMGGVFDTTIAWSDPYEEPRIPYEEPRIAWVEFKGYDKRGRAGSLSDAQVRWGNRMTEMGFPVACFFDPVAAILWLRDKCACPIMLKNMASEQRA